MSANQDAPIKVVSVRVKKELWAEMCQRAEILGLKTPEVIEIALKSYLIIPIETELDARINSEAVFYNSLHNLKSKRSKDLQM